jgi:hypothetical protein
MVNPLYTFHPLENTFYIIHPSTSISSKLSLSFRFMTLNNIFHFFIPNMTHMNSPHYSPWFDPPKVEHRAIRITEDVDIAIMSILLLLNGRIVRIPVNRTQKNEVSSYAERMAECRSTRTAFVVQPETIDKFQVLGVNGSLIQRDRQCTYKVKWWRVHVSFILP